MATPQYRAPPATVVMENSDAVGLAWRQSYSAFLARATTLCHGDRDRAEELVAKATLRILECIASCEQPIREVRAYYFLVLRNLAIDEYRGTQRASRIYDRSVDLHSEADAWCLPASGGDPHDALDARRSLAGIGSLIDQFPDASRALFVQRFVEGRSYGEIAPALGMSEALARKRVQKLRRWLSGRMTPGPATQTVTERLLPRLPSGAHSNQGNAPHAG